MAVSMKTKLGFAVCVAVSVLAMSHSWARGIECRGPYQVVRGHELISTPACQDRYIAQVARERGFKVSNKDILHNPSKKIQLCQELGQDIRIQNFCTGVYPRPGSGGPGH